MSDRSIQIGGLIDIHTFEIFINPCDLRKDLFYYSDYVRNRTIKRSSRWNTFPKADAKRLVKILSDPYAIKEIDTYGTSKWLNYVDAVAYKLDWVTYDTKGLPGCSNSEASFPENFIQFKTEKFEHFMDLSIIAQEHRILKALVEDFKHDDNEFFKTSVMGKLDSFSHWGCATGVLPFIDFAESRRFLLDILKRLKSGIWYSTHELIQYIKTEHPYFLIPQKPKFKYKAERCEGRYCNFHESKNRWGHEILIRASDKDAFERVEGRYIERFLEGAPLTLGYIDAAYEISEQKECYPSFNRLKGFKINDKFLRFAHGNIPEPKVIVCPNFEIQIESLFFPAKLLYSLNPVAEILSNDTITILKLKKEKVADTMAKNESFDLINFLKSLTNQDLPENVNIELKEWAGHVKVFTLYDGFGLFETDKDLVLAKEFIVEDISQNIKLVKSPESLFCKLEKAEIASVFLKHKDSNFLKTSEIVNSVFSKSFKKSNNNIADHKETLVLKRETVITLHFPNNIILETCRQAIIQAKCPIEVERANQTISFAPRHSHIVEEALESIKKDYDFHIEDLS